MKQLYKIPRILWGLLLILSCILPCMQQQTIHASEDITRVYDYGDAFSPEEEADLEERAQKFYDKTGYNYLIITTVTRAEYPYDGAYSSEEECELYSESFYNTFVNEYGSENSNCTIMTLDISENRYADISGQGKCKERLNNDRCDLVFEKMYDALHENAWYSAAKIYQKTTNRYLKIRAGINPDSIFLSTFAQLVAALLLAGIFILVCILQSGGKMTVNNRTYLDASRSKLTGKHDRYIRTETRTIHHSDSSSGGGSSGGGGGGGSHGGGHF